MAGVAHIQPANPKLSEYMMSISSLRDLLVPLMKIIFSVAFLRLLYILPSINARPPKPHKRGSPTRLLIVLGSGGHTSEMISMLRRLDPTLYTHRTYVVSEGDNFSAIKAKNFEDDLWRNRKRYTGSKNRKEDVLLQHGDFDVIEVTRARKIHQSLFTTPYTALQCLVCCILVLRQPSVSGTGSTYPDLILANGPGTAVCVVLAAILIRFFRLDSSAGGMRTIYVESWARVSSLSLSGKILINLVDRFFVQWENLKGVSGRAEYIGVLV